EVIAVVDQPADGRATRVVLNHLAGEQRVVAEENRRRGAGSLPGGKRGGRREARREHEVRVDAVAARAGAAAGRVEVKNVAAHHRSPRSRFEGHGDRHVTAVRRVNVADQHPLGGIRVVLVHQVNGRRTADHQRRSEVLVHLTGQRPLQDLHRVAGVQRGGYGAGGVGRARVVDDRRADGVVNLAVELYVRAGKV